MAISNASKGYLNEQVTFIFCDQFSQKNFRNLWGTEVVQVDLVELYNSLEIAIEGNCRVESTKYDLEVLFSSKMVYFPCSYETIYFEPLKGDSLHHFGRRQYAALAHFFETIIDQKLWMLNPPLLGRRWSNKIHQLKQTHELLPEYSIPSVVKSSFLGLEHNHIIKHVSESRRIDGETAAFGLCLDEQVITQLRNGKPLPFIYQPQIKAEEEFRCYVFGALSVCVRLPRVGLLRGEIDIHSREELYAEAGLEPMDEVKTCFIDAVRQVTQMNLFCVDFFCQDGNNIHLLEVNPLFSWDWLPPHVQTAVENSFTTYCKNPMFNAQYN